jgi:hypothetical protein
MHRNGVVFAVIPAREARRESFSGKIPAAKTSGTGKPE